MTVANPGLILAIQIDSKNVNIGNLTAEIPEATARKERPRMFPHPFSRTNTTKIVPVNVVSGALAPAAITEELSLLQSNGGLFLACGRATDIDALLTNGTPLPGISPATRCG